MPRHRAIQELRGFLDAALEAVSAERALNKLPWSALQPPLIVLGAGKAAAAMARVVEDNVEGPLSGLVVTRYGHACPPGQGPHRIEVVEAGHPIPDRHGEQAALRMLDLAGNAPADSTVLFMVSGGASALLALAADGLKLADKQAVTAHLLHAGARIAEINCVRKHLSAIKGGRLARAAAPARVVTWAISDVVGDALGDIGSGPTIADSSTLGEALEVLRRYEYPLTPDMQAYLGNSTNETPKPEATHSVEARVVACADDALEAACVHARGAGYQVKNLGADLSGEAHELGREHARIALGLASRGGRWALLSGGETTVQVLNPDGRGGPNLEYLAGFALGLGGAEHIHALAADTDGIDGSQDNAGAIVTPTTLARGLEGGMDLAVCLADNRSYDFFDALGDLVITGPTRTNVNDFRVILIDSPD